MVKLQKLDASQLALKTQHLLTQQKIKNSSLSGAYAKPPADFKIAFSK